MTLILDTSILIDLDRGDKTTRKKLKELSLIHPAPAFISFMSQVGFFYGTAKLSNSKKAKAQEFLWKFNVLHTTDETSMWLSHLKYVYDRKGKKKSLTDLFIAAQALEHKLTLVTKDADFKDISEINKIII